MLVTVMKRSACEIANWSRRDRIQRKMERARDTPVREFGLQIPRAFQNERVLPVAIEAMIAAQPLVHEHRSRERVPEVNRNIEHRILMTAHGVVQPAEHKLAIRTDRS